MGDECRVPVHDLHWVSKDKDLNSTGKKGEGMRPIFFRSVGLSYTCNTLVTYKDIKYFTQTLFDINPRSEL